MKTPFLLLAALGCMNSAHAEIPNSMLFQGYLTQSNAPLTGEQTLLVKACDALTDGNCKTVFSGKVQATSGYYTALLENLPVMDKPYWLEVASNGYLLPTRIALTASPYALRALSSQKADTAAFSSNASTSGKADTAGYAVKAGTSTRSDTASKLAGNATGDSLSLTGSIKVAKVVRNTPKYESYDVQISSIGTWGTQSQNWKSAAWSYGLACPSANADAGKLTASTTLNLPDGAIIDSMAIVGTDRIGYPIVAYIDIEDRANNAETGLIDFGAEEKINAWPILNASNGHYRKCKATLPSAKNHVIDKNRYQYFASIYSSGTSGGSAIKCLNPGEFDVHLIRVQVYYHTTEL